MRRRITWVLSAVAAGSALSTLGFTAASASPAAMAPSGTVSEYSCGPTVSGVQPRCEAGYEADMRNFRYTQSIITVPNRGSNRGDPATYVALEHADNEYAAIGIRPCQATVVGPLACTAPGPAVGGVLPNDGSWELFTHIENGGGIPVDTVVAIVPSGTNGVLVSAYWNPNGTSVNFQASVNGTSVLNTTTPVTGTPYTEAEAIGDWRYAQPTLHFTLPVDNRPAVVASDTRQTQFFDGRFTTQSGQRGTFKGPWTLVNVIATSNGVQPGVPGGGTLEADPSFLWTDGFAQGMFGDAFGLWIRA
jgi:hypothetical protein